MAKNLGPTFGDEITTAGLAGLPFVWGATDETITGRENLTAAQNRKLDGVIAAHDPTKAVVLPITPREFIQRFTSREYQAVQLHISAPDADPAEIQNWHAMIGSNSIYMDSDIAQSLKLKLVNENVLTQARADVIFDTSHAGA